MKFVKVDKVPMRNQANHRLRDYFEEFMSANIKIAKVELNDGEYSNPSVARSVLGNSIKRHGFPIDIKLRSGEIYLVRRDI